MFERNFLSLMLAGFLPQLIHLAMLSLYSSRLDLADFGVIGLVMVLINVATAANALQLQNSVGRMYFDYHHKIEVYFSTIFITIIVLSILFFLVLFMIVPFVSRILFQNFIVPEAVLFVALLATPFSSLNQFLDKWFIVRQQGFELLKRVVLANIVSAFIGFLLVVHLDWGVLGYFTAILAGYGIAFFLTVLSVRRYFVWQFHRTILSQSLRFSSPLILSALGGMLFMYFGVVILEKFVPIAVVGMFVLADRFSNILKIYINQIGRLISPYYVKLYTRDVTNSQSVAIGMFMIWCIVTLPIFILFLVAVHMFITLFFDSEFLDVLKLLPFFMVGCLFRGYYIFESMPLFAAKQTGLLAKIGISSGVISVALTFALTSHYGLYGAVFAQMIGLALPFLVCHIMTHLSPHGKVIPLAAYFLVLFFGVLLVGINAIIFSFGLGAGAFIVVASLLLVLVVVGVLRGREILAQVTRLRQGYLEK